MYYKDIECDWKVLRKILNVIGKFLENIKIDY